MNIAPRSLQDQSLPRRSQKRSKVLKTQELTQEEVERSYTGLDRAIAEEFITQCNRKPLQRSQSMQVRSINLGSEETVTDLTKDAKC